MAIQQLDIRPQEGFNSIFSKIDNCEIVQPTYNTNGLNNFFFFKKREGITEQKSKNGYIFLDSVTYKDSNKKEIFYLTRHNNDYVVLDDNMNIVLTITGGGSYDRFIKVLGGGKDILDSGNVSYGCNLDDDKLERLGNVEDNTKTWVVNQFAGNYVFIKDGVGAGQLRTILSNDTTTLKVGGFDVTPTNGSQYVIYESLEYNLCIPYNNGLYVYDGVEWYDMPIFSGMNMENICLFDGRLWYINKDRLMYSVKGDYFFSKYGDELLLSDRDVNNIYNVGQYMLISTPNRIGIIYNGGQEYILKEGLSTIGVKNKHGIIEYKGGLVIIGGTDRMYGIGITSNGGDINISAIDYGDIPGNFIKKYSQILLNTEGDDIELLYIGNNKSLKYIGHYKGWITNTYSVNLFNRKRDFFFSEGYIGKKGGDTDLGIGFKQEVRFNFGEQDIWSWKTVKHLLLMFGKSTKKQGCLVNIKSNLADYKMEYNFSIDNVSFFNTINESLYNGLIGGTIIGGINIGGESSIEVSDIGIMKLTLNITTSLMDIGLISSIEDEFVLGGCYVYYNANNPVLKHFRSII